MNIKKESTYYTAVGHFHRKTDADGRTYPVILVNQEEHMVDIQEMAVWTVLNWRPAGRGPAPRPTDAGNLPEPPGGAGPHRPGRGRYRL